MQFLTVMHGAAALPVVAGVAATVLAALAIRFLWRPRSTPWDA